MKYFKTLTVTFLLCILAAPLLYAQNIDRERMERDINIMEGVLEELFKATWQARGSNVRVSSGAFSFFNSDEINGTYLSGYGVIFTIPGGPPAFVVRSDAEGETSAYSFQYGSGNDKEVTEETIINRMKEFLSDYGSTIGQLSGDDKVTVIYESNRSENSFVAAFSSSGNNVRSSSDAADLPSTIYVTATASDLRGLRQGNISEAQFNDRLTVSTNDEENQRRDLKVMANILKTTFEDVEDDEFRVSGSVKETYVEDLGALFYLDASYGSGFYAFGEAMVAVREKLSKIMDPDSISVDLKSTRTDDRSESELREARQQAYQKFLTQLKETLIDYGRTLKSVDSDEQVLISISLNRAGEELPERVDMQVQKSVLEALDRGSINRETALNRISVQEY